jgi:hypothetical protein
VGGLEGLRAWLRAELFLTNFRPVPLAEHAVFRGKVYEKIAPQESAHGCCLAVGMHVCAPGRKWLNLLLFWCLCVCSLLLDQCMHLCELRRSKCPPIQSPPLNPIPLPQELAQLEEGHPPLREVREVAPSDRKRDSDRLVPLVAEAAGEGHSVLVFCSTRKHCESAAALIADLLPQVRA